LNCHCEGFIYLMDHGTALFTGVRVRLFVLGGVLVFVSSLWAQPMQVTSGATQPFTPANLISNVFLGDGVEVLSIVYNGKPTSVGYFTNGTQAVGLTRGIVMTTGLAETNNPAAGPFGCDQVGTVFASNNVSGLLPTTDPDLSPVASGPLFDVTSYTIRFIPTADTLRFRYCFASEEYPEFACSEYNDLFGFFISGPNYPVPTNIARIPGTALPVAINNIHPNNTTPDRPCPPKNEQYYVNNLNSNKQPTYDGLTRVFTAEAVVVPCDTYVIRLVIADVGDPVYDSGVFLEAKSFGTGSVRTTVVTPNLDSTVVEGCASATLTFRLPYPNPADIPLDYQIFGTAINGVDVAPIPLTLVIPAGQQEVSLTIRALEDGIAEGAEWIAFDVRRDPCHRDTFIIYIQDNLLPAPALPEDTLFCINGSALRLDATLPLPVPSPPFFENTQPLQVHPVNTPVTSSLVVSGVSPPVLQLGVIRSVCLNITHGWVDDLDVYLIAPGGQILELMTDCGANGKNFTQTCFTPTATRSIAAATAAEAPFTGEWQPEGPWSDLWGSPVNGTWRLVLKDDQNGFIGTLQRWSITFEPSYRVQYQWTPAAGLPCPTCPLIEVMPKDTTTYRVTATDSYGCVVSDSVRVDATAALPAPQVSCGAFTASSLAFSWSDVPGATGYLVNVGGAGWMPANGTLGHTVTGLAPGAVVTVEVQAMGTTPCPGLVGSATCSNCNQPSVNALITDASCATASNGRVVLIPDGQNPPYSFVLGGNVNQTGVFDQLTPGTYMARITDGSGCQRQINVTVGSPPPIAVSLVVRNVTCFGGDDGLLRAEASGGTPPYQYLWSDPLGQNLAQAVNLRTGTYTVTVSDRNGCTATATSALSSPSDLVLLVTPIAARCHGEASGVATVTASGGVGPYQFQWANGQTGQVAVGLPAGSHAVTVTDALGCAKASFALITQPPPLTLSTAVTPPSCANRNDGTASVSAQGGTGALTYAWSTTPVQAGPKAVNLMAGTYTVTVSDQNGCSSTATVMVQAPPPLEIVLSVENARCHAQPSGSVTAAVSGGTGTLAYAWSTTPVQNTARAVNLLAGTYTVTVSDQNGCTITATAIIDQPAPLLINLQLEHVRCFGENTGSVSAAPTGGTPPYAYLWSSGETTAYLALKPAGTYSLTVSDAVGCTAATTAVLEQPEALQLSAQSQNIVCHGQPQGVLNLAPSGGRPPYTVLWNGPGVNGDVRFALDLLVAGTYAVTLTDAHGCTLVRTFTLTQPAVPLTLSLLPAADTLCASQPERTVEAIAAGGTPPYTYSWSSVAVNAPTVSLPSGAHTVTVTDAKGCVASATVDLTQLPPLSLALTLQSVDCAKGGTAAVVGAVYGSTPTDLNRLQFLWSTAPPQTGLRAEQLAPGQTYTVTATDPLGCTAVASVAVPATLSVGVAVVNAVPPRCFDGADGRLVVAATGGTPPYTYAWSSGATAVDSLAYDLRAGTYTVTVSDRAGCTGTTSVVLSQPPALGARLQAEPVKCFGENTGALTALPEGGMPPYQLTWPNGQSGPRADRLTAGAYALTVTDRNGCSLITWGEVPQPDAPLGGTTDKRDISCFGAHTGEIVLNATGGTPPYRYALQGSAWNGSPRQIGLSAGTYWPLVSDYNGCTAALPPVTLQQRPPIEVDLGPDLTLRFGETVSLQANVSHAEPPLQYAWAAEDAPWLSCTRCPNPTVQGLPFTRWFTLVVTDALGCTGVGRLRLAVEKRWGVHVPAAFSPNDDGNNDLLVIHGSTGAHILAFEVYDRWGERVFSATDFPANAPFPGWDGTFRGQPVNPGVFVWVLQVKWPDGAQETLQGQVVLVR